MKQFPHQVWKTMDSKDLRQFATAVFFLFAAIGPLSLLMGGSVIQASWLRLAIMTVACGLFSRSIVLSFNRPLRLIVSVILYTGLVFSIGIVKPKFLEPDVQTVEVRADQPFRLTELQISDIQVKRSVFGMTAILCITVGYTLFVRAIAKENRRRAEVEADVKLAQTIHESLLPREPLTLAWCDAAGKSVPAAQIGGDFYDLIPVSEDRLLAVIADASGHGTGAGILSAMTKSGIIQELRHTGDPAELLNQVNVTIHGVTKKNMFVTCAVALFDRRTMTVSLVTAGHPPVLRYDPVHDVVDEFRNPNLALGIRALSSYSSITVPFRSGDLFCFITDGLSETTNGRQEQFGMDRIRAALRRLSGRSADVCASELIGAVTIHAGRQDLTDDISTLIVRIV
jgi:serine phosphatase RsbU (regulator of sigma subunit)